MVTPQSKAALSEMKENRLLFSRQVDLSISFSPHSVSASLFGVLDFSLFHTAPSEANSKTIFPTLTLLFEQKQDTKPSKLTCYSKAFTFSPVPSARRVSASTASGPNVSSYGVLTCCPLIGLLPAWSPLLSWFLLVDEPRLWHAQYLHSTCCVPSLDK